MNTIAMPCVPLSCIFQVTNVTHINFAIIDVEGRNVDELTRRYIDAVDFIAGRPPRPIESADQLERSLEELDWRIHAKQAGKAAHGTIGDMVDAQIVKEQTFVVAKAQG